MPIIEQAIVINAPMPLILEALNDVASIPAWASVTGAISNIQGTGPGMTYDWRYSINGLRFTGSSKVIEQTAQSLITKTTGDIDSLWTINLTPAGKHSTILRAVVEYTPPHTFVEILADAVIEQLSNPAVARENITRFKNMVEARAGEAEEQLIANH